MAHTLKMLTRLCTRSYSLNTAFLRHGSSLSKDLSHQMGPAQSGQPPDYLYQDLKNAMNPQKVLDLVGTHYKIMNSKQLMQALRTLFTLQKYGTSNMSQQQIIQHPDFQKLCHHLKTQAGTIELRETIEALKIVSYVGVSSSSTIVQVLLQLLRHSINDLSLQQIMFLDFLLRQFKSSPLVDALQIALPIVFDINLPLKIHKDDPAHLTEYLQYISKKTVSQKCVDLVVNSLIKCIDNPDTIDPKIAKSIIWSLCDMERDIFYEPLIKKAISTMLLQDINKLEYNEIQTTVTKLINKYSENYPFYYNNVLLDTCANYIVDNDLGIDEAVYTVARFSRISHCNDNLLNYIASKCHENPNIFSNCSAKFMFNLITSLALSEFRPAYWEDLAKAISEADCFQNCRKPEILWLKLAASLCSLGIYKRDVLEIALDPNYLELQLKKQKHLLDHENFLVINQALNILEPDYKYLLPPQQIGKIIIGKLKPTLDYPLEGAIESAVGGENYMRTCLKTEFGHHIDHLIIMRKGGYPIAVSRNSQYLEQIEVPEGSQIVLILGLNSHHYTLNNKRLKATSALMIRTLETKGYIVIPVCMDAWNEMPDFERIPYLMQTIRLKTENDRISNVSN